MKLSVIFWMYFKARVTSWLMNTEVTTHVWSVNMQQIALATFSNGKLVTTHPVTPDTPPGIPGTMDGPPTEPEE